MTTLFAYVLVACLSSPSAGQEMTSFPPPELPPDVQQRFEANLQTAKDQYRAEPDADNLIWVGRRLGYLGRYQEAIETFSRGLEDYPGDARFLRHRGHRYITTRQFNKAVADLTDAARLVAYSPDLVEPDGLPNAKGIPTSTLHTNIYYHLGLAHYVQGQYRDALLAWLACLEASKNPDMEAATRYWLYLTQMRLGFSKAAQDNLAAVSADWEMIENDGYFDLLLLFRGDRKLEVTPKGDAQLGDVTRAYGMAQWLSLQGQQARADALLSGILESRQWAAFAFVAAEADRQR